jgi:enterochelin esterase-like enzyme
MIAYPPAATPGAALPVVVALHGLNGDHTSSFGTGLHLDKYLAQAHQRGAPAFAVASVDGGNSYWHKRASGEDAGAMLTQEFLPLLASKGLDTSRLGFLGYSMGGYGALLLAQTLQSDKVRAVAAESPALWRHPGDTAPGAFDDPADYYAHNVFGHQASLAGIAVQVDCGTGDGFYPCAKAYADGFAVHPAGGFAPGAHDMAYWHRMAPAQLAFLGAHL